MSRTQSRGGLSLWSFKPLTKSSNSASQRNKQLTQRGVSRLRWFHHRSDLSSSSCLLTCCDLRAFYYWSFQKILPFNYHFKSEVDPFSAVFFSSFLPFIHSYIFSISFTFMFSSPPLIRRFPFAFLLNICWKPKGLCSHSLCSHPMGHCFARLLHIISDTRTHFFIYTTTQLLQTHMHTCTLANKRYHTNILHNRGH